MRLISTVIACLALSVAGCAMCDNTFDDFFPAYGGSKARLDMTQGRVGSVFDPAHTVATAPAASDWEVAEIDDPLPVVNAESENPEPLLDSLDRFLAGSARD